MRTFLTRRRKFNGDGIGLVRTDSHTVLATKTLRWGGSRVDSLKGIPRVAFVAMAVTIDLSAVPPKGSSELFAAYSRHANLVSLHVVDARQAESQNNSSPARAGLEVFVTLCSRVTG